jgi:hypothetical protein
VDTVTHVGRPPDERDRDYFKTFTPTPPRSTPAR